MNRLATVLGVLIAAAIAPRAHAQCVEKSPLEALQDAADAVALGLADGPTAGFSTDPRIARVQEKLHAMGGMSTKLSSSALLDAAFRDGEFSLEDAQAFVELRTEILDAWSEARRNEWWFWGFEDDDKMISPWQVDELYMQDLRTLLAELGGEMAPEARALLERIAMNQQASTIPEAKLEALQAYLESRPTDADAVRRFDEALDASLADWNFELYRGPNGMYRRAFLVDAAPDETSRAFAARADMNGDGRIDLEEMTTTRMVAQLEKMFGTEVSLFLTDEGRNFARIKDGKFEIHIDRTTPAHDVEGVVAHEYGHVLLAQYDRLHGHGKREREAEADFVSGWVHGKLGFGLDDSGFGWVSRRWKYSAEDPDHGDFRDRVQTVGRGYHTATGKDLFETPAGSVDGTNDGPAFDP